MEYGSSLTSRRTVLGGGLALAALPVAARPAPGPRLIAGTYANEGGKGLYPLSSDGLSWTAAAPVATAQNASFGVHAARSGRWYLLDENARGSVGVHDAALRLLGRTMTGGADPCHAALSPDETALAIANYSSGNVTLLRLDPATALPAGEAQILQHQGSGPNAARQAGPHAHWVGFTRDARWLHAVDLGADTVFAHGYDARTRTLGETRIAYRAPAGAGPRHLARHPRLPVAYLVAELANTVTVLDAGNDGTFRLRDTKSTLPDGYKRESFAAHIALNRRGTRLYVSNRGHDSIAVFAVDQRGALTLLQHVPSGGHWPRFFLLLEERGELLVANERSGMIATLSIDRDGRLKNSRHVQLPGVVFLARQKSLGTSSLVI